MQQQLLVARGRVNGTTDNTPLLCDPVLRMCIFSVEKSGNANQNALLALIQAQSELTDRKLREQDEKINLLLSAVCGPIAEQREGDKLQEASEGGKLLTAIYNRIEKLERQEQNEIMGVKEMFAKGSSSTDAHIDAINHDIMAKVLGISPLCS